MKAHHSALKHGIEEEDIVLAFGLDDPLSAKAHGKLARCDVHLSTLST